MVGIRYSLFLGQLHASPSSRYAARILATVSEAVGNWGLWLFNTDWYLLRPLPTSTWRCVALSGRQLRSRHAACGTLSCGRVDFGALPRAPPVDPVVQLGASPAPSSSTLGLGCHVGNEEASCPSLLLLLFHRIPSASRRTSQSGRRCAAVHLFQASEAVRHAEGY